MDIEMNLSGSGALWMDIGIFVALIAASAYFSCAETALTGASRARMAALESDGDIRAQRVNRLRERKDALIGALLFGNSFVNIFASAFATSVLVDIFGKKGVAVATVGVTFMVLVFAEVLPKTYALMHPDRIALGLSKSVSIVMAVFSPVTTAVSKLIQLLFRIFRIRSGGFVAAEQEEELRGAIELFKDTTIEDGTKEDKEKGAMLRSILDLANVKVEQIMVHRKNVRMINAGWAPAKIVDEVLQSSYTRLPVWRETQDNIVGVLHTKLLLNELRACGGDVARLNIPKALMEPWFIPKSTTLYDQLQAFRKRREHFAMMVDEYGALGGVITLEDILEEIVGQINDEHDTVVTGVYPQADGSFVVDGKVTIRDLNRDFDWGLPDENYATVAGLLLHESYDYIPGVGQKFTFYDFRFEILKKQRNQISTVRVTPPSKAEQNAAAG